MPAGPRRAYARRMTDTWVPRSLLPGELAAGHAPVRRTRRDWAVDVLAWCGAVALGLTAYEYAARFEHPPAWIGAADLPLGALACLSLWWRRRFPLAVALLAIPALAISNTSFGAGMVLTANLALRVPWRRSLPILGLYVLASVPNVVFISVPHGGDWTTAAFTLAYYLVFFAWGSALRARRLLVVKLREDAERERADHTRRLADTRRAERAAIAREMHDVLAHRISLLSVHAGALAYRTKQAGAGTGPELSAAEVAESAQIIRDNAHQALDELHGVLHVLRADEATIAMPAQPRMADLVDEARTAGQPVDLHDDGPLDTLRPQLQRTAYRVVQEGLTNARKHAPGTRVTIRLTATPGTALTVEVTNPTGPAAAPIPGAGSGLIGLRERVELDGGTLERTGTDGTFALRARLPWPA